MGTFLIGLFIGWLLGSISTAIILAKKNFDKMQQISNTAVDKATDSFNAAKAAFDYYKLSPEERAAKEAEEDAQTEDTNASET